MLLTHNKYINQQIVKSQNVCLVQESLEFDQTQPNLRGEKTKVVVFAGWVVLCVAVSESDTAVTMEIAARF